MMTFLFVFAILIYVLVAFGLTLEEHYFNAPSKWDDAEWQRYPINKRRYKVYCPNCNTHSHIQTKCYCQTNKDGVKIWREKYYKLAPGSFTQPIDQNIVKTTDSPSGTRVWVNACSLTGSLMSFQTDINNLKEQIDLQNVPDELWRRLTSHSSSFSEYKPGYVKCQDTGQQELKEEAMWNKTTRGWNKMRKTSKDDRIFLTWVDGKYTYIRVFDKKEKTAGKKEFDENDWETTYVIRGELSESACLKFIENSVLSADAVQDRKIETPYRARVKYTVLHKDEFKNKYKLNDLPPKSYGDVKSDTALQSICEIMDGVPKVDEVQAKSLYGCNKALNALIKQNREANKIPEGVEVMVVWYNYNSETETFIMDMYDSMAPSHYSFTHFKSRKALASNPV